MDFYRIYLVPLSRSKSHHELVTYISYTFEYTLYTVLITENCTKVGSRFKTYFAVFTIVNTVAVFPDGRANVVYRALCGPSGPEQETETSSGTEEEKEQDRFVYIS